jgi:hypothetical protein
MFAALSELKLSPRLLADGHTITFGNSESLNCSTGEAQLGRYRDQAEIKRAYSGAVVKQTAKKFGWQPAGENTITEFIYQKR